MCLAVQVIEFLPILKGEFYEPLRDEDLFDRVELDEEARTLVWPNGADFDPAIHNYWPERIVDMNRPGARCSTHFTWRRP